MRLICPNCQQAITIPDTEAGKTVVCPQCAQSFPAPHLYASPPVDQIAPPAAVPVSAAAVPSKPPAAAPEAQAAPIPPTPAGYSKLLSLPLSRRFCHWLVPACFTLIVLLTFFKWVGFYPAGFGGYTQNAWEALFADMSVDPVCEKVFMKEKDLTEGLRSSWWMLIYLILVLVGLFLAWVDPVVRSLHLRLPALLESLLRFRPALLAGCAGLTFFLLVVQTAMGFGVENALRDRIPEKLVKERNEAKTPEETQKAQMQIAVSQGEYQMRTTIWLRITILLHILALAGIIGETLLIHRGDRAPPRVGVMW